MQSEPPGASMEAAAECGMQDEPPRFDRAPGPVSLVARNKEAKQRLAHLARTIEADVIPRLVQAHRQHTPAANSDTGPARPPSHAQIAAFVAVVVGDSDAELQRAVQRWRQDGMSVEALYLDLFAPAARLLGEMWSDDVCDFSTVTVALGRLQRLLRELSPAFGREVEYPANGRRVLFLQPPGEQHSFGLSMVAEFFRRDGWDVFGASGPAAADPAAPLRDEWADVVGLSIGSERRLDWLRQAIAAVRSASRNPDVVVMVGGPIFALNPGWVAGVGADGTAADGRDAPRVAARLLAVPRVRA